MSLGILSVTTFPLSLYLYLDRLFLLNRSLDTGPPYEGWLWKMSGESIAIVLIYSDPETSQSSPNSLGGLI